MRLFQLCIAPDFDPQPAPPVLSFCLHCCDQLLPPKLVAWLLGMLIDTFHLQPAIAVTHCSASQYYTSHVSVKDIAHSSLLQHLNEKKIA